MNSQSFFGGNLRDTAALALLIAATVLTVSVMGTSNNSTEPTVAINTAAAFNSVSLGDYHNGGPVKFPHGYTCTPNPVPVSGVTARTVGNSKLALSYDSNRKEALLTATFNVSVNGGRNGVYVYQYPSISFRDTSGNYSYANTQRNLPIIPVTKTDQKTDSYGQIVYWVAPNRNVAFIAVGTVDPKSLLSGTYIASLDGLIGESSLTNPSGFKISVDQNQTNAKTIVGEITPFISSINPNQVNIGDNVNLTGQRLNLGSVYIDGNLLSSYTPNVPVTVRVDGTGLGFTVPTLSPGWHYVTVNSPSGMSNGLGINVINPATTASISASLDPNSPASSVVQVSQTTQTQNVPLAVFDVQSQNSPSTLQALTLNININSTLQVSSLFPNIQIKVGGLTYSALAISSSSVTFTNMNVPLPASVNVPITVFATVASGLSSFTASASLTADSSHIVAIDSNYNTASVNNSGVITGGLISFTSCPAGSSGYVCTTPNSPSISNMSVISSTIVANHGASSTQQFQFMYSITAANSPIYISKTYSSAVMTAISGNVGSVTNIRFTDNDSINDGSTYFYIAPGQTKSFTISNQFRGMPGTVNGVYGIGGFNYGTSTNAPVISITDPSIGNALRAVVSF